MSKRAFFISCVGALAFALVACGGVSSTSIIDSTDPTADATDGGGGDARTKDGSSKADDTGKDGGGGGGDPFACGSTTCLGDNYCIHPCCGGVAPQCVDALDGGGCPSGTSLGFCVGDDNTQMQGCTSMCTPDPPFCSPKPDCGNGFGGDTQGHDVGCVCG